VLLDVATREADEEGEKVPVAGGEEAGRLLVEGVRVAEQRRLRQIQRLRSTKYQPLLLFLR
jgi:hypothetical protein